MYRGDKSSSPPSLNQPSPDRVNRVKGILSLQIIKLVLILEGPCSLEILEGGDFIGRMEDIVPGQGQDNKLETSSPVNCGK